MDAQTLLKVYADEVCGDEDMGMIDDVMIPAKGLGDRDRPDLTCLTVGSRHMWQDTIETITDKHGTRMWVTVVADHRSFADVETRIKERTAGRPIPQPPLFLSLPPTLRPWKAVKTRYWALALLRLMGNHWKDQGAKDKDAPFGMAMRLETKQSQYTLAAHGLLIALFEHSPSPDTIVNQFLTVLAKCNNRAVVDLVNGILNGETDLNPEDWATQVNRQLKDNGGNILPVTELASYYLTNLVVAFRNTGRTPQNSEPPSADLERTEEIGMLLDSATINRNQEALKKLVLRRDGYSCIVTGAQFDGDEAVVPQCAYIIPFSFHDKGPVLSAIEMFTGHEVTAEIVLKFINDPSNAINLEYNAHHAMDKRLAWGIEAKLVNNEWKYYFRAVKRALPGYIKHFIQDGGEIKFGNGVDGAAIKLPDPRLCNLHLAVARVFTAAGFAEVVEKYYRDTREIAPILGFADDLSYRLGDVLVLG